mmetsp:Transcript_2692/g.4546  ORF Transcript_2692/g.4546 Transcript_2692/m.4546 type:complete len:89 (+) Transcript_2692:621-887(+)
MPVPNPTANPFPRAVKLPPNIEDLRKLQVRVDLFKIGEAPRSYSQRLIEAQRYSGMDVGMNDSGSRIALCERFQRIQNAQRAMTPLTI